MIHAPSSYYTLVDSSCYYSYPTTIPMYTPNSYLPYNTTAGGNLLNLTNTTAGISSNYSSHGNCALNKPAPYYCPLPPSVPAASCYALNQSACLNNAWNVIGLPNTVSSSYDAALLCASQDATALLYSAPPPMMNVTSLLDGNCAPSMEYSSKSHQLLPTLEMTVNPNAHSISPNLLLSSVPSGAGAVGSRASKLMKKRVIYSNNILYKTILCHDFAANQNCPRGQACQFAHGEADLHNPQSHDLFHSKLCESMLRHGVCLRGQRCFYAHSMNELKQAAALSTAHQHHHNNNNNNAEEKHNDNAAGITPLMSSMLMS